jgi:tRNA(fMet)-specific endonuclease VapC
MKLLLDTNICIYIIKKRPPSVLKRFEVYTAGEIGLSSITTAELEYGVQKSRYPAQNQEAVEAFLLPLVILDFDRQAARVYGKLRALLEARGKVIGSLDMLIAAHALSLGLPLATNNVGEFSRVTGLKVVNWHEPVTS